MDNAERVDFRDTDNVLGRDSNLVANEELRYQFRVRPSVGRQ